MPFYFWFPVLVSGGLGFMALCIPPVADQFMDLFGVGYGGLSFFLSAYYWTHAFAQVPAGLLVDRIGVLRSFLLCLGVSLVCVLVPFLAPESLALAIVARLVLGACTGAIFLISVKVAKLIAPAGRLARVQGVQGAAFSLGTMAPYLALPLFGGHGWAASYLVCAGICLWFAYGAYRLPPEAGGREEHQATFRQTWDSLKVIVRSREIWFIGCCHGLSFGSLTTVVGNWMPSILADTRPGTGIESWTVATGILLLCGTAGRIFGGEVAGRVHRGLLLNRVVFVIAVSYGILAVANSPPPVFAAAFALALLGGGAYATVYTLAIDTVDPAYVATSIGFLNMVGNVINMLLILVLGMVRDLTGAFGSGLCVAGILALAFGIFSRGMARRIEKRAAKE